jgi:hypothetical protein
MSERKPKMSKERRKVLNLLEFILESNPDIDTVFNVFTRHARHDDGTEFDWVSDGQWAAWLRIYADELVAKQREAQHGMD